MIRAMMVVAIAASAASFLFTIYLLVELSNQGL
jgi:hypothetical protein